MEQKIAQLLKKYKEGTITEQEMECLDVWYVERARNAAFPDGISDEEIVTDLQEMKQVTWPEETPLSPPKTKQYFAVAASLLIVLGVAISVYYSNHSWRAVLEDPVSAGLQETVLRRSTGQLFHLKEIERNDLIVSDRVSISKNADGVIVYKAIAGEGSEDSFDEIETPKGAEYAVILIDGTKVWLNAKTKMRFFTSSDRKKREVWLNGEAYFEVTEDKERPFIVHTEQQVVEVLGTTFNVRAYGEESATTLVTGSVSVNDGKIILEPGQQLDTKNNIDGDVKEVDVDSYIAWKNGYFMFNEQRLQTVMEELANWYDMNIEYQEKVKNEKIWAMVSKDKSLEEVLRMIERTGTARFEVRGRRIVVMQ